MSTSDDSLKQNLRKTFNLNHFVNSKQKEAVKAILKCEQDVVVSMPSGSRKSLCFQLPGILMKNKVTIVCSSSVSTIKNQIHNLKKYKIGATSITATLSDDEREKIIKDVISERPATRFIYVTPEQVSGDNFTNFLQSLVKNDKLAYVAVDDAHYASHRVQDFRQEYLKFGSLRTAYPQIPWIALTHNASTDVLNDIVKSLKLKKPIAKFKKASFRENLYFDVIFKNTILDQFTHLKQYVDSCLQDGGGEKNKKPCGIIYCKDRETVEFVTKKLTDEGIITYAHHGGMRSNDRKKVKDDWMAGVFPVITSTTSFGADRIEKSSIRFVVHWDVPRSVVGYYKESGMAGQDGKPSYCRIYYSKADVVAIDSSLKSDIEKATDEDSKRKALRAHADFVKMSDLCETVICRHKIFSDYFEDKTPNCKDKCDVCSGPEEARVALDLFYRLSSAAPMSDIDRSETLTLSATIIKTEPLITNCEDLPLQTVNGQSIKLEYSESGNQPGSSNSIQPARSVSPANTIIKEEYSATHHRERCSNISDELFEMQTLPPENVNTARILVKEEVFDETPASESRACVKDSKAGINLFLPHRCVSPAETVIEEKPVVNTPPTGHASINLISTPSNSIRSERVIIKNEPKSPLRLIESSESINDGPDTIILPTATSSQYVTVSGNGAPSTSSFVTVIKQEASSKQTANKSGRIPRRESRSPSPTRTIIKGECLSPERNRELENDYLENLTDDSPDEDDGTLKVINKSRGRSKSVERSTESPGETNKLQNVPKPPHATTVIKGHQSKDFEPAASGSVGFRRSLYSHSTINDGESPSRQRVKTEGYRKSTRRSRSRSIERYRRRPRSRSIDQSTVNDGDNPSRQRIKTEGYRKSTRRSRSRSIERHRRRPRSRSIERVKGRSRSRSIERIKRRSRSCSMERFKRENSKRSKRRSRSRSTERSRRISPSRSDKRAEIFSRSRSTERSKRRSRSRSTERSERQTRSRSIERSKRRSRSRSIERSKRRSRSRSTERSERQTRSRSIERSKRRSRSRSTSDTDYGWEDQAPPKPKPEAKQKTILDYDPSVTEKVKEFNNKMKSEYDLDVIEASRKELFLAIEESIALNARKKLTELDEQIRKKNDDYVKKLFGTDNFDSWDDDPALSNVEATRKLKPFKSHVPDDIPLLEKMSMKHVINAMKLTPARRGNELVFHGHIKEIENEFQGQDMPRHLMESMKTEKSIIAALVKKFLKPYYNAGRIQPKELFVDVARKISHIFYERYADENIIRRYIDDIFTKVDKVTVSTNLDNNGISLL